MSNKPQHPYRYLARVVIEFETPFIVGTGNDDLFFDDVFVSDANGLPALPGSSLAGILRHAWAEAGYGDGNDLFGFQKGNEGHGSRLTVSWGCLHDSGNRPVEGIIADRTKIAADPVLSEAKIMTARDHVRINHQGAAADKGKFDERSVSAGHRFTFELLLEGGEHDDANWQNLLVLLRSDAIRIGGKTRRGYGQFKVVSLRSDRFDIRTKDGFQAFASLPVSLTEQAALPEILKNIPATSAAAVTATLTLTPEGFWMVGGGYDRDVDMAPLKANRIVWQNNKGSVAMNRAILTGSAVKGAIAHRVAFHYNRLNGVFADAGVDPEQHTGKNNAAVTSLFGCEKSSNSGQRGKVIISDLFIDQPGEQKILNHVSIDRFTGGARTLEGALYDEKPYYRGKEFILKVSVTEADKVADPKARKALAAALNDLARGQLAIGAGAGRGNGYFSGSLEWNDAGSAWLAGGDK